MGRRRQPTHALAELAEALNETYIPYGQQGVASKQRQSEQDANAGEMSLGALASRAITKAGALYRSLDWDLVDAVSAGKPVSEIEAENLPEPMRDMPVEEIEQVVAATSERREALKKEIAELDDERRQYVEAYQRAHGAEGLGAALSVTLTRQAEEKGFVIE